MREGYKQAEVGEIPEEWDFKELSHVCSMKSGQSITSSDFKDGAPFPCYGGNGLRGFTSSHTHEGKYALIGRQGALCGNVIGVSGKFFASEHAIVVTPLKDTDISWLTFVLRRMNLNRYSESSAQPGLSVSKLLPLEVVVPTTKVEQEKIAQSLSDVDSLIISLKKLIAKKRDINTGTMQQLLTGKKRLPGFGEGKGYKQTELGEIPEDWNVVNLSDIGKPIIGLTYKPSDVAEYGTLVLRSSNVQQNVLTYENNVFVDMEVPERVIVESGDLLICVRNGSRDLIGKCALIDESASGSAFGAFMSIFRSKDSGFIFYQFQSDIIQRQINESMGATINQITNKDMNSFKVPYPALPEERDAIYNLLSDFDKEYVSLIERLEKAKSIKLGMMQELLTGRTRLVDGNVAFQNEEERMHGT